MREILFRGKRLDNGEWVYGSLIKVTIKGQTAYLIFGDNFAFDGKEVKALKHACVDPDTVGQYTGFTDKNGKKIFEGDIVEDGRDYNEEDGYGVVEWNDGAFEVISEGNWSGTFYTNYYGYEFEVIGNIHDNPDLLKGE